MDFKFLRGNENNHFLRLEPMQVLSLRPQQQNLNNEYCFQFDDDEPVVFGTGTENLTITVTPTTDGNITFNHNNRTFKIFARGRQDG